MASLLEVVVMVAMPVLFLMGLSLSTNNSGGVEATWQEIDLRIGASFTRFQIMLLRYAFNLNFATDYRNVVLNYGPCQFPSSLLLTLTIMIVSKYWCEKFYDAYEDDVNVYVVMELCKGGELLDRILSRGGKYSEEDAKAVVVQILSVVAYCHLQAVVHRDLKPELKLGGILTFMRMTGFDPRNFEMARMKGNLNEIANACFLF
ncbi:uncharacterized protein LOC114321577 [Camellia sinensis]|uniref:uncharacterized protein LOC114321577 n=1 Tax=Camellia sinensis TaxID=4442 RepID=UPI001035DE7F|nr:uncharacterized protein LOC114321577 [Camellia sinensis]